jgi:hypothetical protein
MRTIFSCGLLAVVGLSSAALGQSANPSSIAAIPPVTSSPAAVAAPVPATVATIPAASATFVRSGTEVQLRTLDALTSKKKKSKVGDRFQLEVAEPLLVNGVTVIPLGSRATGEVTIMKNKGMWGKRGRLTAQVLNVRVGERQIRLTGTFDESGSAGTAGVVGAALVIPIAGFFVTGTSADIPSGTRVKAFLDEDLPYVVPTPVAVPVVSPIAAAPQMETVQPAK